MHVQRFGRRGFLRIVAIASAGAAAAPFLPSFVSTLGPNGRRYRGTRAGQVLGSDDGWNWALLRGFGPDLPVERIAARDEWIMVTLSTGGQAFTLKSLDERTWYTLDYTPPAA